MGASQLYSPSFSCELKILQAKDVGINTKNLFVRFYLFTGNNKRKLQLDSEETSSTSQDVAYWNNSFSLECLGSKDSIDQLKQESITLELRSRKTHKVPFAAKIVGASTLLSTATIPWKDIFESPNMEIERWVRMVFPSRSIYGLLKPPSVKISILVRFPVTMEERVKRRKQVRSKKWDDECCGCQDGRCSCAGDELFALCAALEAL